MDTHPIIRMSIEVLLEKHDNLQIVLKTDDHRITIDYLRCHSVDLIIMDIDLPGIDGFTFLKKIKQIQSATRVLFYPQKQNVFMPDGPFRLVPVVSSVNVMIKMTFSMLYK